MAMLVYRRVAPWTFSISKVQLKGSFCIHVCRAELLNLSPRGVYFMYTVKDVHFDSFRNVFFINSLWSSNLSTKRTVTNSKVVTKMTTVRPQLWVILEFPGCIVYRNISIYILYIFIILDFLFAQISYSTFFPSWGMYWCPSPNRLRSSCRKIASSVMQSAHLNEDNVWWFDVPRWFLIVVNVLLKWLSPFYMIDHWCYQTQMLHVWIIYLH